MAEGQEEPQEGAVEGGERMKEEDKILKKLQLVLFHLTGTGIVLIFGSLMAIAEMEIPVIIIMALTVGISLIMTVLAVRLIIPLAFGKKDKEKE